MDKIDEIECKIKANLVESALKKIEADQATINDIQTLIKDIKQYKEIPNFKTEMAKRHGSVNSLISGLEEYINKKKK